MTAAMNAFRFVACGILALGLNPQCSRIARAEAAGTPLVAQSASKTARFAAGEGAAIVRVSTVDALFQATHEAGPGAVIEVEDGTYALPKNLLLETKIGTEKAPIVVRARNLLKAEITGAYRVQAQRSEYLALEGFRFTMRADGGGMDGVVSFLSCKRCRVTRNQFELAESGTGGGNQTWLTFSGAGSGSNRVDHNLFQNKKKEGYFLLLSGTSMEPTVHDVVDRNHFKDRAFGEGKNGWETIRGGESKAGNADKGMFLTIRANLFERCDGEGEMISFKAGDCYFLDNTVVNCNGSVCFRDGNRGIAAGNFFFNTYGTPPYKDYQAGGIRFYGSDHKIYNNYFENLNGFGMQAPLNLMHGAPAGSRLLGGADALPSVRCEIVHNTWVNCWPLYIGFESDKRVLPPKDCVFANNIIYGNSEKPTLLQLYQAHGVAFQGNIVFPTGGKTSGIQDMSFEPGQFRVADPGLAKAKGLFRLMSASSPAVDAAPAKFPFVQKDMDGEVREGRPDIGADEFSPNPVSLSAPLTPNDVGPLAD